MKLLIIIIIIRLCGWVCPHKIFVTLLRESGLIVLCKNYFCNNSIYIKRVCKCMVDVRSASRGASQDHAHFLFIFDLENYYMKTDEYFSMIPFASSRLWSKILLKILSSMPDHPKRRGRITPIILFRKLLKDYGWIFFHDF